MKLLINDIKFSAREVDILSCIINLRGAKKIAAILNISHRTVERHIQNIMLKMNVHSQESVKDFIEGSDSLLVLKKHYISLLTEAFFQQQLAKIKPAARKNNVSFNIDPQTSEQYKQRLQNHLEMAGLKFDENKQDLVYSLNEKNSDARYLNKEDYYSSVFEALEDILGDMDFSKLKQEFMKLKDNNDQLESDISSRIQNFIHKDESLLEEQNTTHTPIVNQQEVNGPTKPKTKKWIYLIAIFLLVAVIATIWFVGKNNRAQISSDLTIPHSSNFLERTAQLAKLENAIAKDKNDIKIVALVGVGGSGKTVLARNYARKSNSDMIWEINAGNIDSLVASFEDLANALSDNEEDLRILKQIAEIKEVDKKNRRILNFVSRKLQSVNTPLKGDWLLLYDNVNQSFDVSNYLPTNPKLWGTGTVILTSRDKSHLVGAYINPDNIIQIEPLTIEEARALFRKIASEQAKQEGDISLEEFLEQIPPYPLDISIAAYFINEKSVAFKDYLRNIGKVNADNNKDLGNYDDTRTAIVGLSAKNLLSNDPDLFQLMLLSCLVDGHAIDESILARGNNGESVSKFVKAMIKHGLLYSKGKNNTGEEIYVMHDSTQRTLLEFLLEEKDDHQKVIDQVLRNLFDHFSSLMNEDKIEQIKQAPAHLEKIAAWQSELSVPSLAILNMIYGNVYFYLSNNLEAEKHLRSGIQYFERLNSVPVEYTRLVVSSWINLGNVYSNIGKYSEAQKILTDSVTLFDSIYPDNPYYSTSAKIDLARIYVKIGKYQKAKSLLEEGYKIYRSYFGDDHPETAWIMLYYGDLLAELGEYEYAEYLIKMHIQIIKKHFNKDHIRVSWGLTDLANLYIRIGLYEQAKTLLNESKDITFKYYDESSPNSSWMLHNMGLVESRLGNLQESFKYLNQSYRNHLEHNGEDFVTSRDLLEIARLNLEIGKVDEALPQLGTTLSSYDKHFGKKHLKTAQVHIHLAKAMVMKNEKDKALEHLKKAQTIFMTNNHPEIYLAFEGLSRFYKYNHNADAAKVYIKKTEETLRQYFPMESEITKRVIEERRKFISKD